ncbi:MAG: galactose-1-phosphate uridylyltransferase [Nitrospirae bacterium]|nr:galactose-1-phosphate uridylyltransferase [Nitrospirota bacterium]
MNELRKDLIHGRWIEVLSESKSPSEYLLETVKRSTETTCVLCQGREKETPKEIASIRRTGTAPNTPGWWVRAIPSFKPLFQVEGNLDRRAVGIYDRMNNIGANEILIESPEHNIKPEDMGLDQMIRVIKLYKDRVGDLSKDLRLRYIFIFKNSIIDPCRESFSHPVSFLIATPVIPKNIKDELDYAKQYYDYKERCIFCDIIREELKVGERIILETRNFLCFCPYASSFPFESWIIPKRHNCDFHAISGEEVEDMGLAIMNILQRLKAVFKTEPPFNYFLHTAPNRVPRRGQWHTLGDDYHWHLEIIPRLIVKSGFELGSGLFIQTTMPEKAAKYLREV